MLSLHHLAPHGGPFFTHTVVTVTGRGFHPVDSGALWCRFGGVSVTAQLLGMVNSSAVQQRLLCTAPATLPAPGYLDGTVHVRVGLEVSLDGANFTSSGLKVTYFTMDRVLVSSLTPRGGPRQGGTRVRVAGGASGTTICGD